MTLTEMLEKVEYLTDAQGNRRAVVIDAAIWEQVINQLEWAQKVLSTVPDELLASDHKPTDPAVVYGNLIAISSRSARVDKLPPTLEELVAGITEENKHGEWDTGQPVGNEVW